MEAEYLTLNESYYPDVSNILIDCYYRLKNLYEERRLRKEGKHLIGKWIQKNGQPIKYKNMTDRHLKNAIRYFERKQDYYSNLTDDWEIY